MKHSSLLSPGDSSPPTIRTTEQNRHEYTMPLFVYRDGTLAVHSGDIHGLVIETRDIEELQEELHHIAAELLESNHGLTDEELEQASIRLVLRIPHDEEDHTAKSTGFASPRILWGEDPRPSA